MPGWLGPAAVRRFCPDWLAGLAQASSFRMAQARMNPARAQAALAQVALAIALLAVLLPAAAGIQRSLRFERLTVEKGLPQESGLTILQDRKGFVWLGTHAGLCRFDGYRLKVFKNDAGNPASLPDNFVTTAHEDGAGRLWFGTKTGVVRYDRERQSFIRYQGRDEHGQVLNTRSVTAIASGRTGELWLGTLDGLQHFDPASGVFRAFRHDPARADSLSDNRINAVVRGRDGSIWVATSRGLDRIRPGTLAFERYPLADASGHRMSVLSLALDSREPVLWLGTSRGLQALRVDGGQPTPHAFARDHRVAQRARVQTLHQDREGNLWMGTERHGLLMREAATGQYVGYRHHGLDSSSLSDDQVASIIVDRSGTLWVGTVFGGVNRADLSSGGFERHAVPVLAAPQPGALAEAPALAKIRALVPEGANQLWVGTWGTGLGLLNLETDEVSYLRHDPDDPASLPDDLVTYLLPQGPYLWITTPAGLARMDRATRRLTRLRISTDHAANNLLRVSEDRSGKLWVASRRGLHLYDPVGGKVRSWVREPQRASSLTEDQVHVVLQDRRGRIWVGTDNGLDRFDGVGEEFTHFRSDPHDPASLRHQRIHELFEARDGTLWVGTAAGLQRIEEGPDGRVRFRYFGLNNGREADRVSAIRQDKTGFLWISSTSGLTRLNPATGQFRRYSHKDGLLEGSYFVGSSASLPDGRLAFGGADGLTAFQPEEIRENPFAPPVLITDVMIFNQPLRQGQLLDGQPFRGAIEDARELRLSHRDSVLSFEFAALHFADPERNRYTYQLEGFDRGWISTDARRRFATYTNLDPGRYVFRVRASNKDGVWQDAPAALTVIITPPWWKTWWARTLILLLVVSLGYAVYRMRVLVLVDQQHRLRREVGARTAELLLEKDSVERQKREALHQKELAEQAHRNIALLSEIGRRLTSNLDTESIMTMLYEHVRRLMDASVFGVGIVWPERAVLELPFVVDRGERRAPSTLDLRDTRQLAMWAIANAREVFINDPALDYPRYALGLGGEPLEGIARAGTRDWQPMPRMRAEHLGLPDDPPAPLPSSLMYVPIAVSGRVLGVLTVQSYERHAYDQMHLDMLRTLASYMGIALDNAEAYRQLKNTQAQLVEQEKLAALGSLVAGVAHELNTPIGNSVLMASTLHERTEQLNSQFSGQALRRSELEGYLSAAGEATSLILRSLHSAADLVNSFKQVAVDQASAQRRRFNLQQTTQEIMATMMNHVRKAGHTLEMDMPADIVLDSYPGPYGQVVINLINNMLLHAFDAPGGQLRIQGQMIGQDRVRIAFQDNGCGIAEDHQARIFDPFFTTKMGQGGSGLGLNITYNIVVSLLQGAISVDSAPGHGSTFIIELPLQVHQPAPVLPQ